jgi:hypothetical protein
MKKFRGFSGSLEESSYNLSLNVYTRGPGEALGEKKTPRKEIPFPSAKELGEWKY